MKGVPVVAVWLLMATGCSHAPAVGEASTADARGAILAASRAFSDAYVRNDPEALGRLYTTDAVLMPASRQVRGRAEAQRFFTWGARHRQLAHSMESSSLEIRGDTAVDVGTWHSTSQRGEEPVSVSSGAYLVVWVRESDGAWRMKYDVWHRPVPAAPVSP